jgi:hypothetical protein
LGQLVQEWEPVSLVEYEPAVQLMHDTFPVDGCWVPVGQSVHTLNPSWFPYVPVGQSVQVSEDLAATAEEY